MELTAEQKKAINEINNNLQIIACAGSGKTEVITRRIVTILKNRENVKPENIVAFTFTNKAAESMKIRIRKKLETSNLNIADIDKMYIGTIHGYCNFILKQYCKKFQNFKILDSAKNFLFITRYYNNIGMKNLDLSNNSYNINLFIKCIEKLIDDCDNIDKWDKNIKKAFEDYRSCLYEKQYLDYSMLIYETINQLRENPSIISSIKYLIVDEYQDVNDLQEKIINFFYKNETNICVVGDDDQTIYRFRGSNADNMIGFVNRYENVTQIRLEENFRCNEGIVDVANEVISNNINRLEKMMKSNKNDKSIIECTRFDDASEQYTNIAEEIRNLCMDKRNFGNVAILVRKGKYISDIVNVLKKYSIPYKTDSAENYLKSVYFAKYTETLNLLTNLDKSKLIEIWKGYIGDEFISAGYRKLRRTINTNGIVGNDKLAFILRDFLESTDFLKEECDDIENRKDTLEAISKILNDYDEIYQGFQLTARITGILDFLGRDALEQYKYTNFNNKEKEENKVQIMTIHKAKGLEFENVFIPNLQENEFPARTIYGKKYWHILGKHFEDNKYKYQTDIEDERKLFYVAVTRAKQNLHLYFETSKYSASIFLVEAANSKFLKVDKEDLEYQNTNENDNLKENKNVEKNQKHEERQKYWQLVKYAKEQLIDYYGTGMHFCKGMGAQLSAIYKMKPDEIIEKAKKDHLI